MHGMQHLTTYPEVTVGSVNKILTSFKRLSTSILTMDLINIDNKPSELAGYKVKRQHKISMHILENYAQYSVWYKMYILYSINIC